MTLYEEFYKHVIGNKFWNQESKIVVGVSGGVDSVVLLHLLVSLPKEIRPQIHVAHINHQLRAESREEQILVESYSEKYKLDYTSILWEEGPLVTSGMELKAREFRYNFFESLMDETNSQILLTAHHQDDQIETILMRIIQGSSLVSLKGIEMIRDFNNNKLIRPLLFVKKAVLYEYAREHQLVFLEDESNESTTYFRNRVRKVILPLLEEENPRVGDGLLRLSEELSVSQDFIVEESTKFYQKCVKETANSWELDVKIINSFSQAQKIETLKYLLNEFSKKTGIALNHDYLWQLKSIVESNAPHQTYYLPNKWQINKSYEKLKLCQIFEQQERKIEVFLKPKHSVYLNQQSWVGLFEEDDLVIPSELSSWKMATISYFGSKNHSIHVRKREAGDRFVYNQEGQTKKVGRFFIDQKIPVADREKSWVVLNENQEVIWLMPFRESYLSIPSETDKIQYKLVYCYKIDE